MTLPTKGSRTIEVDGVVYRWIVSPDSGFMVVVVEAAKLQGQRVEAYFDYANEPVTSAMVREIIKHALSNGWEPLD